MNSYDHVICLNNKKIPKRIKTYCILCTYTLIINITKNVVMLNL